MVYQLLQKAGFVRVILGSAALALAACGYPDGGLLSPSVVDGKEASERINMAAVLGSAICAARTGTTAGLVLSVDTDRIYGIDTGRAYKDDDVKACEESIKLTTALSSNCSPTNVITAFVPTCSLKPVDKVTGGG